MKKDVAELGEAGALERLLERYAAAVRPGPVAVAFAAGGAMVAAGVHEAAKRRVPVGCIAKLLTASLVTAAAQRGAFALEGEVLELLDATTEALRGVTVRHLLEHTHGLDDSMLASPRCASAGFIDTAELLQRVGALTRWASPGAVYSYGNLGAWLLAALLERVLCRTYAELVRELLASSCLQAVAANATPCPARGIGLEMTAEDLARFGRQPLTTECIAAPIVPLPGWHPLEVGICLGWKAAGGGWFGHQSVWPGASIYLRVQPARKLALVVVARERAAALVALGVFGEHFPELFEGRARLPTGAHAPLRPGVYAQAARAVCVTSTTAGLRAEAWEREAHGAQRRTRASAVLLSTGAVVFAQPANELMPYLEVVAGSPNSAWVWNGRTVLRRID